ncbi:alpha-L-arabinofuranosidase C-terminal domain-containing protein [Catalinimonas niigatensis]|uniref:alpha-L-arabinofuranosidase C-terminal domain-containing protein n=1 Tax=Catalinimonas niigatensis TaxID=1397264 RepID=UPI002666C710|nr:alpha-L-arabinofuranosidase C-terminal domain-containing protein [Catalinimonas niigatensis]WPP50773.1 alpha-L-arabinofuranosidase C-terminal domain-containing protein [Catalinimonas niigatensis]
MQRRDFIKIASAGGASLAMPPQIHLSGQKMAESVLTVNPVPLYELSPYLYMQFMEPLGTTDSSVEASWDHAKNQWKPGLIEVTKELAPGMMRWGGNLSAYYKWREGVGPRKNRVPFLNTDWGGMETNQIGTAEFVDFSQQVGAESLMCLNFESDGLPRYAVNGKGENRSGDSKEAAAWVDYCNNPSNKERIRHGFKDPLRIGHWQLGNETSYRREGFDNETAALKTVEFAKALRAVDASVKLIGWGDSGWAKHLVETAGEHLNYVAFHNMFDPGQGMKNSPVKNNAYRKDPAATWEVLMDGYKVHEQKILKVRDELSSYDIPLALTECHYAIEGRNRCEVLSSWAAGISYARIMNLHERHGDKLKIATMADFCGTRWQVNAIMIPVPHGQPFMMPAAKIMWLYKKHSGKDFVKVSGMPQDLDVTASRTDDKVYLHVVNTSRSRYVPITFAVEEFSVQSGKAYELSTDPEFELMSAENDPLLPKERDVKKNEAYEFPPASVTAVELNISAV